MSMDPRSEDSEDEEAAALLQAWLRASESGEPVDWDEFVVSHPRHAGRLCSMRDDHRRARELLAACRVRDAGTEGSDDAVLDAAIADLVRGKQDRGLSLLGPIARGGMAIIERVWDGRLARPLVRKVLPMRVPDARDSASRRRLARFLQEARISSRLQHPGILPIHDIGIEESGRPYFTMPIVRGEHFGTVIRALHQGSSEWSFARAVQALVDVCETVAYAHSRGVVHRDLKPGNVMLGAFGETFVMDWGLAKVIRVSETEATAAGVDRVLVPAGPSDLASAVPLTVVGAVVGTPAFMAPEQAVGVQTPAEPSADQYSIGAILYELLGNRAPFSDFPGVETTEQLIDVVGRAAPTPLERLAPRAAVELIAICNKAMQREPGRRYANVAAMAADLRAFLDLRVVQAHDSGPVAVICKWARRNRAVALITALLLLVVLGGIATYLAVEHRRGESLQRANRELLTSRSELADRVEQLRRAAYLNDLEFAQRMLAVGDDGAGILRVLDACDTDLRGWEWRYLRALADSSTVFAAGQGPIGVSASGRIVALGDDGTEYGVVVRAVATGAELCRYGCRGPVDCIAVSDDGRFVASASRDQCLRIFDIEERRLVEALVSGSEFHESVAFVPGRSEVIARRAHGEVVCFDARTGREIAARPVEEAISSIAVGAEGRIAMGCSSGAILILDGLAPDAALATHHVAKAAICSVRFSADGRSLVAQDIRPCVHKIDLATGTVTSQQPRAGNGQSSRRGAFDPRCERFAIPRSCGIDLIDVSTGELRELHGHRAEIRGLAFLPDGRLLSSALDGSVRLWANGRAAVRRRFHVLRGEVIDVAVSPHGDTVAAIGVGGLSLVDLTTERILHVNPGTGGTRRVEFAPDGESIFAVGDGRALFSFDARTLEPSRAIYPAIGGARVLRFLNDGRLLHGADDSGWDNMGVTDLRPGGGTRPFRVAYVPLDAVAAPQGGRFAMVGDDGALHLLDIDTLAETLRLPLGERDMLAAAWSPDGRLVAAGGFTIDRNFSIPLIDPDRGVVVGELLGSHRQVVGLRFSPCGRLLSAETAGPIRVWDVAQRRALLDIALDSGVSANSMDLAGDGRVLAVGARDGDLYVWSLP